MLSRIAPFAMAAMLVLATPVFAFADAGPKHANSLSEAQITSVLDKVDDLKAPEGREQNHGFFLSSFVKDMQGVLGSLWGSLEGATRGQLVRLVAKSDLGKEDAGDAAQGSSAQDDKAKKDKNNDSDSSSASEDKGKENAPGQVKKSASTEVEDEDDDSAGAKDNHGKPKGPKAPEVRGQGGPNR